MLTMGRLTTGANRAPYHASEGKTFIMRIAKVGEVVGLSAAISGIPNEVAAEALRPCQVAFVRREDFLKFLAQHPEGSMP